MASNKDDTTQLMEEETIPNTEELTVITIDNNSQQQDNDSVTTPMIQEIDLEDNSSIDNASKQTGVSLKITLVLTKHDTSISKPNEIFKYFVPSTQLFYNTIPGNKIVYLVQWCNFSLLESTWISEEEINKSIDPNGLIKIFNRRISLQKTNQIIPFLNEALPVQLLVPSKIIRVVDDESEYTPTKSYYLKWLGHRNEIFVSSEPSTFFSVERNKQILKRWNFECGPFPLTLTQTEETTTKILHKNYIEKNSSLVVGGFGKRTCTLAHLNWIINNTRGGKKNTFLIVVDNNQLSYYQDQIEYLIPGFPITFITNDPVEEELKILQGEELFSNVDNSIKPQIIFKKLETTTSHLVCILNDINKCDEYAFEMKLKTECETKLVELPLHLQPYTYNFYIRVEMSQKQQELYQTVSNFSVGTYNLNARTQESYRVLLYPSTSIIPNNATSIKVSETEQLLSSLRGEVAHNKSLFSCSWLVCVDPNALHVGVDLSMIDYVIMLTEGYSIDSFEHLKRTKRFGMIKNLRVIYFVTNTTLEIGLLGDNLINYYSPNTKTRSYKKKEQIIAEHVLHAPFSELTQTLEKISQPLTVIEFNKNEDVTEISKPNKEIVSEKQHVIPTVTKKEHIPKSQEKMIKNEHIIPAVPKKVLKHETNQVRPTINEIKEQKEKVKQAIPSIPKKKGVEKAKEEQTMIKEYKQESFIGDIRKRTIKDVQSEHAINEEFLHLDEETKQVFNYIVKQLSETKYTHSIILLAARLTIETLLKYGKNVENWPNDTFVNVPIQLKLKVFQLLKEDCHIPYSFLIDTRSILYNAVKRAIEMIHNGSLSLNIIDCPWGKPCDLLLIICMGVKGIEQFQEYLQNDILRYMLVANQVTNEQDQIVFIKKRTNELLQYLTNSSIKW
ncbi:Helicase ATP-binding domain-containing protein [Entamoeba marina]